MVQARPRLFCGASAGAAPPPAASSRTEPLEAAPGPRSFPAGDARADEGDFFPLTFAGDARSDEGPPPPEAWVDEPPPRSTVDSAVAGRSSGAGCGRCAAADPGAPPTVFGRPGADGLRGPWRRCGRRTRPRWSIWWNAG